MLNAPGDHHFRSILKVIGHADLKDDPQLTTCSARVQNVERVDQLIEDWTRHLSKYDLAKQMLTLKVPCAPVRQLSEVMLDENTHEKGSLQWIDHSELGRVVLPHSPLIFEGLVRKALEPSLPLGASNAQVFGDWLGYSVKDLEQLKVEGVVS